MVLTNEGHVDKLHALVQATTVVKMMDRTEVISEPLNLMQWFSNSWRETL